MFGRGYSVFTRIQEYFLEENTKDGYITLGALWSSGRLSGSGWHKGGGHYITRKDFFYQVKKHAKDGLYILGDLVKYVLFS